MEPITSILPSLRLAIEDQDAAKEAARQVVSEAGQDSPDKRNIRTALAKLKELLIRAGNLALANAIDYELNKLGLPHTG